MKWSSFILMVLFFCYSHITLGQVKLGIGFGLTYSTLDFTEYDIDEYYYRTGLSISLPIEVKLTEKINFGLTPNFSQKGAKSPSFNSYGNRHERSHYFQIIPEVRYELLNSFFLGAGFYYAIHISDFVKSGDDPWRNVTELNNIKNNDFGFVPSMSYNYKNYSFIIRYLYGIQNISTAKSANINIPEPILVNRVFEFSFAYHFSLNP